MVARWLPGRVSEHVPDRPEETLNDTAIAVVVAAALLIAEAAFAHRYGSALQPHSMGLLLAGSASLALLSRLPLVTAVVVGLCLPLYYMTGGVDGWFAWLLLFVAVMRSASAGRRAAPVVTVLTAVAVFGVGESLAFEPWRTLAALGWIIAVVAAAQISRGRAQYLRAVEERAAEAERTREEEARRRASEERLHIARELHDVIAHNISLINVQAASALHRREPEQAMRALESIKGTSKDTLRELRATLGVLRQVDREHDGAPEAPAPGVGDLTELIRRTRAAGLDVDFTVDGAEAAVAGGPGGPGGSGSSDGPDDPGGPDRPGGSDASDRPGGLGGPGGVDGPDSPDGTDSDVPDGSAPDSSDLPDGPGAAELSLPSPVGLAVYRIVQESLTNVRRHAGSGRAEVAVDHPPGRVVVRVADGGTGGTAPYREGNGLRGMRERATALGASFEAGPVPGGGFRVRASFPVD